jgi:hypothetical protein
MIHGAFVHYPIVHTPALNNFLHGNAALSNEHAERCARSDSASFSFFEDVPTIPPSQRTPQLHVRPHAIYDLTSTAVPTDVRPCSPPIDAHRRAFHLR